MPRLPSRNQLTNCRLSASSPKVWERLSATFAVPARALWSTARRAGRYGRACPRRSAILGAADRDPLAVPEL